MSHSRARLLLFNTQLKHQQCLLMSLLLRHSLTILTRQIDAAKSSEHSLLDKAQGEDYSYYRVKTPIPQCPTQAKPTLLPCNQRSQNTNKAFVAKQAYTCLPLRHRSIRLSQGGSLWPALKDRLSTFTQLDQINRLRASEPPPFCDSFRIYLSVPPILQVLNRNERSIFNHISHFSLSLMIYLISLFRPIILLTSSIRNACPNIFAGNPISCTQPRGRTKGIS